MDRSPTFSNWLFGNPRHIDEVYDRKKNFFNFLRLCFAMAVVYTHSFVLFGQGGDAMSTITRQQADFSQYAVWGFFVISGFLITQSLLETDHFALYFIKRALRIFPAFLFSLSVFALLIGPLLSKLSLSEYYSGSNGISPFEFVWKNISLNMFGNYAWGIRDLFDANPYKLSVNGSMWTLKFEFACYMLLPVFMFFKIFGKRIWLLLIALIVFVLIVLDHETGFMAFHLPYFWWVLSEGELSRFWQFLFLFLLGSIFYVFRDRIYFTRFSILLCLLLLTVSSYFNLVAYALLLVWPYLVIVVGVCYDDSMLSKYGDFSYGVYIYSFPTLQTLAYLFAGKLDWLAYVLLSYLITFAIAVFSWRYIEKPALSMKSFFRDLLANTRTSTASG